MSMYRQLWLAIIASMLLALGGGLLASLVSARSYLESQLSIKNTDNATALALSLSLNRPDATLVELAVASLFDGGHYEWIRVTDPMGNVLVERTAPVGHTDAPAWFASMLPIKAEPGRAQISNGWQQVGVVILASHSRFAYGALWKSAYEMVIALSLAGFVGGLLGSMVLRRLRGPLDAVIDQANAILQRRFVMIAEPRVPELRQLAVAMNTTVARLKKMFEEEASRLEVLRRDANFDGLTGLANRNYFLARLRETVTAEDSVGGSVFIARVANLSNVNRDFGRQVTDDLLRAFSKVIGQAGIVNPDALAARLNGADFALLMPGLAVPNSFAEHLLTMLTQESALFVPDQVTTWLGCGTFPRGTEVESILAQVDAALAAVELEGQNGLRIVNMRESDEVPRSADEWSHLIQNAISNRWVRLVSFPVTSLDGVMLHRECPLRLMFDEHGEWQPAGRFLPVAQRLKLTPQLDLAAVALGLDELVNHPELSGLAINLSASSIEIHEFRIELEKMLKEHPATSRLWLEVPEAGVWSHFEAFKALCSHLRGVGCKLGLEHFGRQFSEIGRLHDLGLDYLKVDGSFIRGLGSNEGNQAFLKGLSSIAHSIGIFVIAEGVTNANELTALKSIGFDGATGPAIQEPSDSCKLVGD